MAIDERIRRVDAQRNREAVIDSALELLARQPTASMATIAEASGLGRTTVYRHFTNRDELIRALFMRVVEEAEAATSAVIGRGLSHRETLRELGPAIVAIGQRFQFLAGLSRLGDEVIQESTLNAEDPVRRFLLDAQRDGAVRADLPIQWLATTMNGLAAATMIELGSGRLDLEEAGRLLGEAFVRCFGE